MITRLLLLSLAVISSATPIYDVESSRYPIGNKIAVYPEEDGPHPTVDLREHVSDLSIESADVGIEGEVPLPPLPQEPGFNRRSPPTSLIPTNNPRGHLSMTRFKTFAALMPTFLLCQQLEDFYSIIALKIETGAFSTWAPAKNVVLHLWDFELSISCDKMTIPWSFIQAWVIDMAELSSHTFTGFYEAVVRGDGPLSGLVFLIHMKLKDPLVKQITGGNP